MHPSQSTPCADRPMWLGLYSFSRKYLLGIFCIPDSQDHWVCSVAASSGDAVRRRHACASGRRDLPEEPDHAELGGPRGGAGHATAVQRSRAGPRHDPRRHRRRCRPLARPRQGAAGRLCQRHRQARLPRTLDADRGQDQHLSAES